MKLSFSALAATGCLLLGGCSERGPEASSAAAIESVQTPLGGSSCQTEIDPTDPNDTPYEVCPGVAGYKVIVRRVASGRNSIDVVDPSQHVFPLNYQDVVTRQMFSLGDTAEWRVKTTDGKQDPVALIVRVLAREDGEEPDRVTQVYTAVAKIQPGQACVTDRIAEAQDAQVHSLADRAHERGCAQSLAVQDVQGTR